MIRPTALEVSSTKARENEGRPATSVFPDRNFITVLHPKWRLKDALSYKAFCPTSILKKFSQVIELKSICHHSVQKVWILLI